MFLTESQSEVEFIPPAKPDLGKGNMLPFSAVIDEINLSSFAQIKLEHFSEMREQDKYFITVFSEGKYVTIYSKDLIATRGRFWRFTDDL